MHLYSDTTFSKQSISLNRGKCKCYTRKEGDFMSKLYSCDEIAKRYSVQVITVWGWIRKKKLSAIKIGKEYRISEEDIRVFEDERRTV